MLIGDVQNGRIVPSICFREVTRLGGRYSSEKGLAPEAMERTLLALKRFSSALQSQGVTKIRAVGTLALRRAINADDFVSEVARETGLLIDVIDGNTEASLSCEGVLSALESIPDSALIFDIGGGSTEFVFAKGGIPIRSCSYDLGVVALAETCSARDELKRSIGSTLQDLLNKIPQLSASETSGDIVLVGTAGTVTTLAALDLGMNHYDWRRVNNHVLARETLERWLRRLDPLSPKEREELPGIEEGRGDLIVPGLEIVLAIMEMMRRDTLVVSDFGLLEGALLSLR